MTWYIEKRIALNLMEVACSILDWHFFYSDESRLDFCEAYARNINTENTNIVMTASQAFKRKMRADPKAREDFSKAISGFYLAHTLHTTLKFNSLELDQFEEFLQKYLKKDDPH